MFVNMQDGAQTMSLLSLAAGYRLQKPTH